MPEMRNSHSPSLAMRHTTKLLHACSVYCSASIRIEILFQPYMAFYTVAAVPHKNGTIRPNELVIVTLECFNASAEGDTSDPAKGTQT